MAARHPQHVDTYAGGQVDGLRVPVTRIVLADSPDGTSNPASEVYRTSGPGLQSRGAPAGTGRGSAIRDAPRVKREGRGAELDEVGLIEGTRDLVVVSRDQREQVPVA